MKKNTDAVVKHKKKVSIGLIHLVLNNFLRRALTLVLILTNNGPRRPPSIPRKIAPGINLNTLTTFVF